MQLFWINFPGDPGSRSVMQGLATWPGIIPYVRVSDPGAPGKIGRLNLRFFWRRVYIDQPVCKRQPKCWGHTGNVWGEFRFEVFGDICEMTGTQPPQDCAKSFRNFGKGSFASCYEENYWKYNVTQGSMTYTLPENKSWNATSDSNGISGCFVILM